MAISRKQRIQMVLRRERPDRLPTHIIYTPQMANLLCDHYGVSLDELPYVLDRHMVNIIAEEKLEQSESDCKRGIQYDIWGVGWNTQSEGFQILEHPINSPSDFLTYKRPGPQDEGLLNNARTIIARYGSEMFISGGHGFLLFEGATNLLGFERFMTYLITERDFISEVLDCLTKYHVRLAQRMLRLGVDGGVTGDDWGAQRGMLVSPRLWREMIKPRIAKIWEVYHKAGLPVMHHSCGDITPILDDLVELGLAALNPVQPKAMDHRYIVDRYGKRLSFCGGLCNQTTLPFGSTREVQNEVRRTIELLGRFSGYIIGPSHEMTTDIPIKNVEVMTEAIQEKEPWK